MDKPIATNLCEIVELTDDKARVMILAEHGYMAEFRYALKDVPEPARMVGGCFYIDTFNEGTTAAPKYVSRTRRVDESEEREILAKLFHGIG